MTAPAGQIELLARLVAAESVEGAPGTGTCFTITLPRAEAAFIRKPFTRTSLSRKVREVLDG